MVAATLSQFVFLSVDDYGSNLLIHENENDTEQSWEKCNKPPPNIIHEW